MEVSPQTTSSNPKVVIIGGGFGGLYASRALANQSVDVTLIDRTNHHLFQPLLYQVATAMLSPADIAQPIRAILKEAKNIRVVMGRVESIDTSARVVHTHGSQYPYQYLIVAAGARHSYFGNDHWEEFAPGLKNLSDALELRRRILNSFEIAETTSDPEVQRAAMTFVVIGAGWLSQNLLARNLRKLLPDQVIQQIIRDHPNVPQIGDSLQPVHRLLNHRAGPI